MKYLFSVILILFIYPLAAQSYQILEAKKVTNLNESKVRKGDQINRYDTLKVAEKGVLVMKTESAMPLKLGYGTYYIYDEARRHNRWYNKHLSLTGLLKRKNLISCKFNYKTIAVPGSDRHFEMDRIEVDQKGVVRISDESDSLSITWYNPDYKYKGKYYIILRDYYNQGFVDILETHEKAITLYLTNYDHRHMYYSILAEDCRASLRYKIEILTNGVFFNERTNFLGEVK